MTATHLSLSWHHYNDSIKAGFSQAQQNGDFVDLTLAADGHLIKVHQLILGIASPYIRSLIQSAPCEHPVIFLNDISYKTLCSLLEYIYAGEVVIDEESLGSFLNAAKALRIRGLDNMDRHLTVVNESSDTTDKNSCKSELSNVRIVKNSTIPSIDPIPSTSTENWIDLEKKSFNTSNVDLSKSLTLENKSADDNFLELINDMETSTDGKKDTIESLLPDLELTPISYVSSTPYMNQELQYTVSNRGSLQLILNRYIYNIFSRSNNGQVRRWRCVDYRDHKCPACAVTNGNVVVKRTNMHNHPFHDKKIMAKLEKEAIYSAIKVTDAKT